MRFELKGNAPSCLSAGILLLSKARSFGQPVAVSIEEPQAVAIHGPVLAYSPLLLALGLPGTPDDQNMVILPGQATKPLLIQLSDNQIIEVDRTGRGELKASKMLIDIIRSSNRDVQQLGFQALSLCRRLGVVLEPAALDILFNESIGSVIRTQLFLHIGRHLGRQNGQSLSTFFLRRPAVDDDGPFQMIRPFVRTALIDWLDKVASLSEEHLHLSVAVRNLVEDISLQSIHRLSLPFSKSELGVVRCLSYSLSSISRDDDAIELMRRRFKFLGGVIQPSALTPNLLSSTTPPESRAERWDWLMSEVRVAETAAEAIWRQYMDPMQ